MKLIRSYEVVRSSVLDRDPDSIEKRVNLRIKLGWQPLGGISVSNGAYYQAMVKIEDTDETAYTNIN